MTKEMTIFKKSKELIDYTFCMTDSSNRFPKKTRFTFVNRMQNLVLDIYQRLLKVNEIPIPERPELQIETISELKALLFLVELSFQQKYINSKQCEVWTGKILDVQHLTAAWLKKSK
ncbi:hypothetical protein EUAN_06800 [Andreesenia angusta]|uniref:Diversity-generating retroelement protein Avd n=1 Tax=Andreesenia angusta TaxID=39480 RepID=A0A1S1V8H6_9FIRM|nr:four helix bundle protein [Andreesenia angusta]OHW62896.1 hypothetical protein EUAN_06800 [Andreesenia angusta]